MTKYCWDLSRVFFIRGYIMISQRINVVYWIINSSGFFNVFWYGYWWDSIVRKIFKLWNWDCIYQTLFDMENAEMGYLIKKCWILTRNVFFREEIMIFDWFNDVDVEIKFLDYPMYFDIGLGMKSFRGKYFSFGIKKIYTNIDLIWNIQIWGLWWW